MQIVLGILKVLYFISGIVILPFSLFLLCLGYCIDSIEAKETKEEVIDQVNQMLGLKDREETR